MLIGAGIFLGGLSLTSANAETYIAGQVGYTISHDARGVEVIDPQFASPPLPSGTTSSNIDLKNAIMYGMKIGHYFNAVPWLGVEVEGFITTPHVLQQKVTLWAQVPSATPVSWSPQERRSCTWFVIVA